MLSSLEGGVVGAGAGGGATEASGEPAVSPLARNCWCRRLGRKGLEGITCILELLAPQLTSYNPVDLKQKHCSGE